MNSYPVLWVTGVLAIAFAASPGSLSV